MSKYQLTYKPFGDLAILIEWPAKIDEAIIEDIVSFERVISDNKNILDTIIAYNSLMIQYRIFKSFNSTVLKLKELYAMEQKDKKQESRLWQIPVCYDLKFGLDLEEISKQKNIAVDEVIRLHTEPNYLIYFLGFQPGFLYLGGLNKQIHIPRRPNPRLRVEKGTVGIGGEQTGVYPQDSAGGWNLIGKSPIRFFEIDKPKPCFASAGDRIQFEPISLKDFQRIELEVAYGIYELKSQEL